MNNFNSQFSTKSWILKLFLFSLIICSSLIIYGYKYPTPNLLIEVPPVMALLDPQLFKNDYYVQDTLGTTPKYYYQYLVFFLAKLVAGVPGAYFFAYLLSFSSFVVGLYALGKKFGRSDLAAATLVFLGLFTIDGTVGYVSLFRQEPIASVLPMGLSIWGIYFSFCRRWSLGYFFFGVSCLIQFLVGFLPGLMMVPILLLDCFRKKDFKKSIFPLLILVIFAGLIYLPMALNGSTGSGKISDEEFVFLYGYIRQPHHIIPSSFPIQNWRSYILLMMSGVLFINNSDDLKKENKIDFIIIIAVSFFALFLGYIFVEIHPIATITKLQFARTTPFAKLIVLIAISVFVSEHYKKKNFALCLLLIFLPVNKNGIILLFLVAVGFTALKSINKLAIIRSRFLTLIAGLFVLLFTLAYPLPHSIEEIVGRTVGRLLLFLVISSPVWIEEFLGFSRVIKAIIYSSAVILFSLLILGLSNILPENLSRFFQSQIQINQLQNNDLETLALRFKNKSSKNALVLTPPSMTQFRFYSQRSVVYNFYSSPYTDGGLEEWKNRLTSIVGTIRPPISLKKVDLFYRQRTGSELVEIAHEFGADYILTNNTWHPNINGKIVDRQGDWIIYQVNSFAKNNFIDSL